MFEGFTQQTVDFMWGIRLNNDRGWFLEHKDDYVKYFYEPMKMLGKDVFEQVTEAYPDYGFTYKVARIYRDARRVRDGRPYRDHLWFSVEPGFHNGTVFWFELNPEGWHYAFGFFSDSKGMAKYRARIDKDPKKFEKLINLIDRQSEFILECDEYSRKKEAPTKKTEAWYNRKYVRLVHYGEIDDELFSGELTAQITNGFISLMPLYEYFSTINNDPEPS